LPLQQVSRRKRKKRRFNFCVNSAKSVKSAGNFLVCTADANCLCNRFPAESAKSADYISASIQRDQRDQREILFAKCVLKLPLQQVLRRKRKKRRLISASILRNQRDLREKSWCTADANCLCNRFPSESAKSADLISTSIQRDQRDQREISWCAPQMQIASATGFPQKAQKAQI
jgi:hypothetical protein